MAGSDVAKVVRLFGIPKYFTIFFSNGEKVTFFIQYGVDMVCCFVYKFIVVARNHAALILCKRDDSGMPVRSMKNISVNISGSGGGVG